jgi:ATP-binding cassette subfamily C protein LapB
MQNVSQLFIQIPKIWLRASASYSKENLWLGIIIPSLFINFLMLALPLAMLQTYDRIIPNSSTKTLSMLIILVIAAAIIEMTLRTLRSIVSNWSFAREDYLLITKLSEKILRAKIPAQANEERETILTYSDLINRTKQSHNEQVVVNFLDLIFILVFLRLIGYIGGFLVLVPITIMAILAYQIYKRSNKLKSQLLAQKDSERKRISLIIDTLSGIFTLKALAMEPSILRHTEHLELRKAEENYNISLTNMEINSLVAFFSQLIFFLTVSVGAIFVIYGSLTVGGLAACTLLAGRGMQPIARFISLWGQQQDAVTSQIFLKKIDALPEEPFHAKGIQRVINGQITLEQVSLKDNKKNELVMEDISLEIAAKETICIFDNGSSGWSLLYAIMGLIPTAEGKIFIDNTELNAYNLQNLRRQICYMAKEGVLYNGSILENISGFDPDKEAIAREISMQIGLENIISKFPQGLQTKVGSNATQIYSAGFRQLVSFTRTMVNNPKILLLNNITFNVDKQALRMLARAINLYQKNMTVIITTTEPSLFPLASRIFGINNKHLEGNIHE